jgi:hypothetical protein
MPALPRRAYEQNLSFSGAKQFINRKFPFQRNEKRSGILVCISEHFHKVGAEIFI